MAFDSQKPGDATNPLVAAVHTIATTTSVNVWLLAALLLPKPCLPLVQACATAFPPASKRLVDKATATVWNTSVALIEVSIRCALPCSLVRLCVGCSGSVESHMPEGAGDCSPFAVYFALGVNGTCQPTHGWHSAAAAVPGHPACSAMHNNRFSLPWQPHT